MKRSGQTRRLSARRGLTTALMLLGSALTITSAGAEPDRVGPSDETVLSAVCGGPVPKGARTCRTKDGRTAEFWYGATFSTETRSWFTGFVTMPAPGEDAEAPDARTVAAATYADETPHWHLKGVETLAGRIGTGNRNGDAPEVDAALGPVIKAISRRRLLMGLRLKSYGSAGSSSVSVLLLRFRETPLHWALAGEVPAGSDETANCPPEDEAPCRFGASKGRLDILPEESAGPLSWPPIRITLTGTVKGHDGTLRAATDRDARVYRFDEVTGAYH